MAEDSKDTEEQSSITCRFDLAEAIVLFDTIEQILEHEDAIEEVGPARILLEELYSGLGSALDPLFNDDWENMLRLAKEELVSKDS